MPPAYKMKNIKKPIVQQYATEPHGAARLRNACVQNSFPNLDQFNRKNNCNSEYEIDNTEAGAGPDLKWRPATAKSIDFDYPTTHDIAPLSRVPYYLCRHTEAPATNKPLSASNVAMEITRFARPLPCSQTTHAPLQWGREIRPMNVQRSPPYYDDLIQQP